MSNVMINIASEFDSKGFKNADKATSALDKSMKRLAKTVVGVFSAQKVLAYSKASVKAFAEDQKAAALLSNQLKNLGLAYAAVDVEKFIAQLQTQTGILDDELRPAFAQLARVTGSVAESQKLMATAFDVSKGAGIGFLDAVNTLSQAYVGNKRGLRQLNLGLTQAELTAMSFDEILTRITKQFKGAGAAAMDTYAGKLDLLKVSADNAKETIGQGFIDAFTIIADDQDFNNVLGAIDGAALAVADMIRGVGVALRKIDSATPDWLKKLVDLNFSIGWMGLLRDMGANSRRQAAIGTGGSYFTKQAKDRLAAVADKKRQEDLLKKEREKTKLLAKQTAEKKAQAALDKANLALSSANNIFDIERVGIAAAMQNQSLTENERKRLEIKQAIFALEDAIDSKDTNRITAQTAILNGLVGQFSLLQKQDSLLGQIKTAYDALGMIKDLINLQNLKEAYELLLKMQGLMNLQNKPVTTSSGSTGGAKNLPPVLNPDGTLTDRGAKNIPPLSDSALEIYNRNLAEAKDIIAKNNKALQPLTDSGLFDLYFNSQELLGLPINPYQMSEGAGVAYSQSQNPVNITINGSIGDLLDIVVNGLQQKSASGISTTLTRNTSGFNW